MHRAETIDSLKEIDGSERDKNTLQSLHKNFQASPKPFKHAETMNFGKKEQKSTDMKIRESPIEAIRSHENLTRASPSANDMDSGAANLMQEEGDKLPQRVAEVTEGPIPPRPFAEGPVEKRPVDEHPIAEGPVEIIPGSTKITKSSLSTETVIRKTRKFSSSTHSTLTQEPVKVSSRSNGNGESEGEICSISSRGFIF